MKQQLKLGLALFGLATICTLAHFFIVTWIVHSLGHGYKWITLLTALVWLSIFGLLAANLGLTRLRTQADEQDSEAHTIGRG